MVDLTPNPELTTREAGRDATRRRHSARELTGDNPTVEIELDEQVYTLRITKTGKLILTK